MKQALLWFSRYFYHCMSPQETSGFQCYNKTNLHTWNVINLNTGLQSLEIPSVAFEGDISGFTRELIQPSKHELYQAYSRSSYLKSWNLSSFASQYICLPGTILLIILTSRKVICQISFNWAIFHGTNTALWRVFHLKCWYKHLIVSVPVICMVL